VTKVELEWDPARARGPGPQFELLVYKKAQFLFTKIIGLKLRDFTNRALSSSFALPPLT